MLRLDRGEFGKLFFVENLCPYNQSIYDECYNLKKNGDIDSVWVYHGIVNIKHTDSKKTNEASYIIMMILITTVKNMIMTMIMMLMMLILVILMNMVVGPGINTPGITSLYNYSLLVLVLIFFFI